MHGPADLSPGLSHSFRRPHKQTASRQNLTSSTRRCEGMALWKSATRKDAMLAVQSTIFCPAGRYRKMTIEHLLLPRLAYKQGLITALGTRTGCALHEMDERRRYVPGKTATYRAHECQALLGPAVRVSQAEHAIEALARTGLVHWSPSVLRFPTQPAAVPNLDLSAYTAMRAHMHPKRVWFPMARRMLRYLAREGSPGLIATGLYVALRCFWDPTQGVCAGAVSLEALAACCDFSERTASRHLTTFERLGWLHWDPRPRRYERAYGRWYVINPTWKAPQHPTAPAPRPRRPRQLSLPLPADAGSSPLPEACTPGSVDAEPPAAAQASSEDGCKILSGCEGTSCKILSGCTARNASNPANSHCSSPPIPFQEIFLNHQTPTPQADTTLITLEPSQAILSLSEPVTGVQRSKETPMRDPSPEKPTPSQETWDALEARYANLPADHQAALRADAVARLVQQGHQRDFLIEPVILHDICCLLAAQEGWTAPVAPAASADVAPPPAPARPTPAPALGPPTLDNVIPADLQVRETMRRALELGRQAHARGWIRGREPDRLYVVAAALHAGRCGKDNPCGLYRWLLEHPDEGSPMVAPDEPEAHALLKAYEYGIDPQQRKPSPSPASTLPALSKYAWIVREQQRLCTRAGLPVDVCELVRQACPALSGEAQDSIVRELAQYQRAAQQAMALHRLGELGTGEDGLAALSLETLECAACGAAGPACVCREDCEDG